MPLFLLHSTIIAASWENRQSASAKTKTQISFAVTAKLISTFVFATRIVQFLFYLNLKFQASSSFLCLYRSVCVGPVRKPHCWFSHEVAHIINPLLPNQSSYISYSYRNQLSRLVGKPTMWFPNRSDTNRPVQAQKRARSLKFRI